MALKLDQHRLEANTLPYFSDLEASKYKAFEVSLPKRDMQKAGLFYEGKNLNPWMKSLETSLYYQTVDRDFKNHIVIDKNSLGLQPPVLSGARDVDMVSLSDDEQSTAGVKIRSDLDLFPFGGTVVGLEYEFDQLETTKNTAVKPQLYPLPFQKQRILMPTIKLKLRLVQFMYSKKSSLMKKLRLT